MVKYATAVTIGCRLNQADTALIFDVLKQMNFEIVQPKTNNEISVVVINTCSVTASASQKSRQAARSWKKKHPDSYIISTGCSVDIEKEIWDNENCIDLIIPNTQKSNMDTLLANDKNFRDKFLSEKEDFSNTSHHFFDNAPDNTFKISNTSGYYPFKCRANLKIQEGCDSFCTYCIVPYGRGKPRSRDFDDTLREFKELLKRGHKEIVLTGVNIATYNCNGMNLSSLLEKLIKVPGDFRIRLSSTEPQFDNNGLIDIIASSNKICRFLHLPIQHGHNKILESMGRKYTTEDFRRFVKKAIKNLPNICIGTDIITGFPGETDELFEKSKEFIASLPLAYMHVFKYSKRNGTPAAKFNNQVDSRISTERHKKLSDLSIKLDQNYLNKQINTTARVLIERKDRHSNYLGWSDNYINIKVDSTKLEPAILINSFSNIKLNRISGYREISGNAEKIYIK